MRSYQADYDFDFEQWRELMDSRKTFRIGTDDPDNVQLIANLAYVCGDTTLVIEECAVFFKRGLPLEPWAKRIVFMGRHTRSSLIVLAQRASSVPIDIRSQALRLVTFAQQEKDDVAAICSRIGNKYRDKIRELKVLECLDNEEGHTRCYSIGGGVESEENKNTEVEESEKDETVEDGQENDDF
jgi:DNA helicase HerA-like ATPase